MTAPKNRSSSGGDDDSWGKLASDLFGINLNADHDLDLSDLEPPPAPKVRPHLETPAAEILSPAEAEHRDASSELDEETQKFIAQSLTDVDLFASYGLTQKAIGLLEAILRRAPRHTPSPKH